MINSQQEIRIRNVVVTTKVFKVLKKFCKIQISINLKMRGFRNGYMKLFGKFYVIYAMIFHLMYNLEHFLFDFNTHDSISSIFFTHYEYSDC